MNQLARDRNEKTLSNKFVCCFILTGIILFILSYSKAAHMYLEPFTVKLLVLFSLLCKGSFWKHSEPNCAVQQMRSALLKCSTAYQYTACTIYVLCTRYMCIQLRWHSQSPKLKSGYRYKNQFWNRGFTNGVRCFVDINIFYMKYYII